METSFYLQKLLSANGNFWLSASGNFCYQANTTGLLIGQFGAQCCAFFIERRRALRRETASAAWYPFGKSV